MSRVYLFVRKPRIDADGTLIIPSAYWSTDPQGSRHMTKREMFPCGLKKARITVDISCSMAWRPDHLEALQIFYQRCGFDANSDELSRYLNLNRPRIQPVYKLRKTLHVRLFHVKQTNFQLRWTFLAARVGTLATLKLSESPISTLGSIQIQTSFLTISTLTVPVSNPSINQVRRFMFDYSMLNRQISRYKWAIDGR